MSHCNVCAYGWEYTDYRDSRIRISKSGIGYTMITRVQWEIDSLELVTNSRESISPTEHKWSLYTNLELDHIREEWFLSSYLILGSIFRKYYYVSFID
jgi:hypothetical protein